MRRRRVAGFARVVALVVAFHRRDGQDAAKKPSFKPFISQNLIVRNTIYTHTIDKFKQMTKTLWAI